MLELLSMITFSIVLVFILSTMIAEYKKERRMGYIPFIIAYVVLIAFAIAFTILVML